MAPGFQAQDFEHLVFPVSMYVDYIRIYQRRGISNGVTCNPPSRPTSDYINRYNKSLSSWMMCNWTTPLGTRLRTPIPIWRHGHKQTRPSQEIRFIMDVNTLRFLYVYHNSLWQSTPIALLIYLTLHIILKSCLSSYCQLTDLSCINYCNKYLFSVYEPEAGGSGKPSDSWKALTWAERAICQEAVEIQEWTRKLVWIIRSIGEMTVWF